MKRWARDTSLLSQTEIKMWVSDPAWQKFRLSLKGEATEIKLDKCLQWLKSHDYTRASEIQVQNYINALKRGGYLDMSGNVVR